MPRYMETAAEANAVAKVLMRFILDDSDKPAVAELIARLVNLGIRCAPRAVQSTVRYNAVRRAVADLPVDVSMIQKKDERTGKMYNVLLTKPHGAKESTVEGMSGEDE